MEGREEDDWGYGELIKKENWRLRTQKLDREKLGEE